MSFFDDVVLSAIVILAVLMFVAATIFVAVSGDEHVTACECAND